MKRFKAVIQFKSGREAAVPIWGKDAITALHKYVQLDKDKNKNKFTSSVLIEGGKEDAYFLVGHYIEFITVQEYSKESKS